MNIVNTRSVRDLPNVGEGSSLAAHCASRRLNKSYTLLYYCQNKIIGVSTLYVCYNVVAKHDNGDTEYMIP